MRSSRTLDMTQGPVLGKLLSFVIPAILSNIIQQMYTIADRIVVGRFAENGTMALAAVGSTNTCIILFLDLFYGMALGANITCANFRGARDAKGVEKCMHTAIPFAAVGGVIVCILGSLLIHPMLRLLDTPDALVDLAALYMRIYFLGTPASLIYNCGANLLRAHGDTKRPMYLLTATGLVNVGLNLVLVIGFRMGVAGVAVATVISQYLSAIGVLWILFSPKDEYKMSFKKLCMDKKMIGAIARIGIPTALNSTVFTLSNTIVLAGVNSFNSAIISAAKTAVTDLSTMIYQVVMGVYVGCVSASGQCFGAKKYRRIDRLAFTSLAVGSAMLAVVGVIYTIFGRQLIGAFNNDPRVIEAGWGALMINAWFYVLYLLTQIPLGCVRGMRKSLVPGLLTVVGICLPRILWVWFAFPVHRSLTFLFVCYPISWIFSSALQWGYYFYVRRKILKSDIKAVSEA